MDSADLPMDETDTLGTNGTNLKHAERSKPIWLSVDMKVNRTVKQHYGDYVDECEKTKGSSLVSWTAWSRPRGCILHPEHERNYTSLTSSWNNPYLL